LIFSAGLDKKEEIMKQEAQGYGLTNNSLILQKNGDVESFDLQEIQAAIDRLPAKSFYQRHCVECCHENCSNCQLMACPLADQ
jgi:hypothetical protein